MDIKKFENIAKKVKKIENDADIATFFKVLYDMMKKESEIDPKCFIFDNLKEAIKACNKGKMSFSLLTYNFANPLNDVLQGHCDRKQIVDTHELKKVYRLCSNYLTKIKKR